MKLTDLKAVFFDLDNVLVFSELLHFKAWQATVPQFGINPGDFVYQEMAGRSDGVQAKEIVEKYALSISAEALAQIKTRHFLQLSKQEGFLSPSGRESFLKKTSENYTVGLVSSSFNEVIHHVIAQENIASFFHFTIGYEDCPAHKPHPFPYLAALQKTNLAPHQALVIEDSISGITSALNANIPVVGILKDQTPSQLIDGIPYFRCFSEIDAWLSQQ